MSLSILNNISALQAENALSTTQTNLSNTLTQLSTGMRINSGSDDAAGLSIANGLTANISALTQSGQNATNATGLLQTADGGLSQVTSLLNRAVTLATEASSDGLTATQGEALNTEFQSIISSINNIGGNTNFNGTNVFSGASITPYLTDGTSGNNLLGTGTTMATPTMNSTSIGIGAFATASLAASGISGGDSVVIGGTTYNFTATSATAPTANTVTNNVADQTTVSVQLGASDQQSLQNLADAINGGAGAGITYGAGTQANANVTASVSGTTLNLTALSAGSGSAASGTVGANGLNAVAATGNDIGITGNADLVVAGGGTTLTNGSGTADLLSTTNAQVALVSLTSAINQVSQMRGTLGADMNQLTAASNVMTSQVTNLQSADNGVMNADIGKTVANMTQYNVLQSTGMSALQQANQAQQAVLKLLQ